MKKFFSGLAVLLPVLAILAFFQYWAFSARERDWWWFNGGPDHMAYADLLKASDGKGHILLVERIPEEAPQTEFDVRWDCFRKKISWGESWTRDVDFNQLDRSPAPAELRQMHDPKNPIEREFIAIACSLGQKPEQVFELTPGQSPLKLTKTAFDLIAKGVHPYYALQKARSGK